MRTVVDFGTRRWKAWTARQLGSARCGKEWGPLLLEVLLTGIDRCVKKKKKNLFNKQHHFVNSQRLGFFFWVRSSVLNTIKKKCFCVKIYICSEFSGVSKLWNLGVYRFDVIMQIMYKTNDLGITFSSV